MKRTIAIYSYPLASVLKEASPGNILVMDLGFDPSIAFRKLCAISRFGTKEEQGLVEIVAVAEHGVPCR